MSCPMSYCPIVWGNETGQGTGHIFNLDLYGQGH